MNKKKRILIASFFAILMLMLPITTVTGSFSTSGTTSSSDKETKYLITFSKDEIRFFGALLDRMLRREIKLTETEIGIAKGIRNKIAYEKVELNRDEIRFLLDIFCRITDGEMKLTDYEIKTLKSIFSKISNSVIGLELPEDKLKNLEGTLDLSYGKIKLTENQITQLENLANSFEDAESRTAAHNLVNHLVNAEGELDLAQVKLLFSGDYQIAGIISIISILIKKIIEKITDKIMEIMLQLIKEWINSLFANGRSGWVYPAVCYYSNVSLIISGVKDVTQNIKNEIDAIRNAVKSFIYFKQNPNLASLVDLVATLWNARGCIKSLWENISILPETIRSAIEELYENTTQFTFWFVPDLVDPVNYTEMDRAYNQPIQLNVHILAIEPDKMQNVEIYCDYQTYTPSPDGFLEIGYSTYNKDYPYWIHIIELTITDKNTNPHRISTKSDDAFSDGSVDITADFSGRPDKPYGPIYVIRFDTHLYKTNAINPSGASTIYYQWDWGEYLGEWYGPRTSGAMESKSHTWLTLGTHNVKVRAGDTSDGSGWVSEWSDTLEVTVERIKLDFNAQSQQSSQTISSNEMTINSMTFNLMEMMTYGQSNANSN